MISLDPDLRGDLIVDAGNFELRPLAPADAGELFAHLADVEVTAFMDIPPLNEIEDAHAIIDWASSLRAVGGGVRWSIRERTTGAFVGTAGFNALIIERGRRGEIAYDLGRAWWGRGVMAGVLPTLVSFGFERLTLRRLEALVTPGNDRSCRLLERHGFAREGVLREYGFWKGRYWDQIVYGRLSL